MKYLIIYFFLVVCVFSNTARADDCLDIFSAAEVPNTDYALTPLVDDGDIDIDEGNNYSIELAAGENHDYDNIKASQNFTLTISGTGTARLHLNGSFELGKSAQINADGDPEDLVIYINGNLTIDKDAEINALIWTNGNITIKKGASITGSLSANGNIDIKSPYSIVYSSTYITSADFSGMCDAASSAPDISIDDITVDAGDDAEFTITLSKSYSEDITISYATSDDTAIAGSDYTDTSGTVTITSGDTSATVSVGTSVTGEGDFTLSLSDANYGSITDSTATATITAFAGLLAEYRFEEQFWSGDNEEVIDETGSYNGTAYGASVSNSSPAISGDPGTCRYAEFDGSSDYIALGNPDGLNISGEITLAAWIRPDKSNSIRNIISHGHRYNPSQEIIFRVNGGKYQVGSWNGSNHIASMTIPSGDVGTGTWIHLAATYDGTTWHLYKNGVQKASNTDSTGAIEVDENWAIGARGTGTQRFFDGGIDEVRIYNTALSADEIQNIYAETHDCASSNNVSIDHYEIIHDGSGLTCASEEVTIKACTDSDCSSLSSETVTLDLLGNGNTLTSTSFTGSTEVSFSYTTPETLTLSLDNKPITADNDDQCSTGSTSSCDIVFSDAGFRFLYGSNNATSIDNQISGTEFSEAIKLQAVEDIDGVCTGLFTGNVDVDLAQENISPSGTDGLLFEINGQNIAKYPNSTSETLYFDSDSIATITAPIYNDAGQITLHADYNQNDINLTGSSNNFWVSPSYLKVDAKNTSDTTIDGASANAIITHKAGEDFALNISAYNSQDEITTNYSPGNMQFMLTRTGPLDSTSVDGTLTYAENKTVTSSETDSAIFSDVTLTNFSDGEFLYSSAQYSEVGLLNLDIQDSNYGGEDIIISANDINIGRFTPYYFEITSTTDGALSGGNPFVYSGQLESTDSSIGQISYSTQPEFIITAKSANDNTTKNYSGDYMKLEDSGVIRVTPNTDAAQVGADNINLINISTTFNTATIDDSLGMVKYQFANSDNYIYTREENAIIAPFTADIELQITSITDNDGITANDSDSDTSNGILTLSPTGVEIRFGRWNINNSYGPEIADLRVPMQVQYWDGTRFSTNTNDSFTTFDSNDANITIGTLSTTPSISGSGTFSNGITNILTLSAPGASYQGNLTLTMEVPSWLQFDWDNEDTYTDDPDALITFGLYRGNDRVIYRGEVFE